MNYERAVQRVWRPSSGPPPNRSALFRELVRYASLAPSSHNTQCWRFQLEDNAITLLPDWFRRCPVVDPDDHHLFVSLGCATENLVQAARAHGFEAAANIAADGSVRVTLRSTQVEVSPWFEAMLRRQCTRAEYDGSPLSDAEVSALTAAATGSGVRVLMLTDRTAIETVLDYVIQGNTAQLGNPAFLDELKSWIRFNDREAIAAGDGLSGKASGNPSVPRWFGRLLFKRLLRVAAENEKYARQVRSSAGIAVFISSVDDRAHWMEAGRCYERFALEATARGIRNAFLNQPVEEAALRPRFAAAIGVTEGRPDLVVRFGRGKEMPRSLRRPVEAVLI